MDIVGSPKPLRQLFRDWKPPMSFDFLVSNLNGEETKAMLILEYRARRNPYCFMRPKSVALIMGKSLRTAQRLLASIAEKGWIRQVHRRGPKSPLVGIVMLKRADPDLPAAETDEQIESVEAFLRGRRLVPVGEGMTNLSLMEKPTLPGITPSCANALDSDSLEDEELDVAPLIISLERIANPRVPRDVKCRAVDASANFLSEYLGDFDGVDTLAGALWQIDVNQCDHRAVVDVFWEVYGAAERGEIRSGSPGAMFTGRLHGRWDAAAFADEIGATRQ